ncbi:MAG: homoserine O-acetyltransferase [Candidatus Hydrogenedentota bacterium]
MVEYKVAANSVGVVETKYFDFDEIELESGKKIAPVRIAYETYGKLNKNKDNAILLCHALSADAHVAGYYKDQFDEDGNLKVDEKPGWWDNMVGPSKAFDTDKYFVICSNVICGCKGSTGPSSIDPTRGEPYGLRFPVITIKDMVNAEKKLIDYLGIRRILTLSGGSIGGMQALQWAISYPERIISTIPQASSARPSAQAIAFNEVARRAIMSDPNFNKGDYYGKERPRNGLAIARMMGHITYLSEESMKRKFGRKLFKDKVGYDFDVDFQVESYLRYQGEKFVERFDANTYLYMTKARDYYDLVEEYNGRLANAFINSTNVKYLLISFTSDWLFPTEHTKEIVRALQAVGADVSFCEIECDYGHDAFLLETDKQTQIITNFLNRVVEEEKIEII